MEQKKCLYCNSVFFRKDQYKKVWGLKKPLSDYHWSLKKYCSYNCKNNAKQKRNDYKEYHKEWRGKNKDKVKNYSSRSIEARKKASKKYYFKKKK